MAKTVLGLFSGAGGLDLGFELAGFSHIEAVEVDPHCCETLRRNRPNWRIVEGDVREYKPKQFDSPDVLLAGFPCQGFSLGGNRDPGDARNNLYLEVVRLAKILRPRVVVVENVLNLRTMLVPGSSKPFAEHIKEAISDLGYSVIYDSFRLSHYGVPQTRRRFLFIGFRDGIPPSYHLPQPGSETVIRAFLYDLAQGEKTVLPNHTPHWGFRSAVHRETCEPFDPTEEVVPVRFSRTASDGNPIRTFDAPFPAVDTATVWGWAQGNVRASRFEKNRLKEKFIRNPHSNVTLWRISASRLRTFTHREYARLQTFPDDWEFLGVNKRDIHLQIGNAVPVEFAKAVAQNLSSALDAIDSKNEFSDPTAPSVQMSLFAN